MLQLQPHEVVQHTAQAQPHGSDDRNGVGTVQGRTLRIELPVEGRATSWSRNAFSSTEAGRKDEIKLLSSISILSHVPGGCSQYPRGSQPDRRAHYGAERRQLPRISAGLANDRTMEIRTLIALQGQNWIATDALFLDAFSV